MGGLQLHRYRLDPADDRDGRPGDAPAEPRPGPLFRRRGGEVGETGGHRLPRRTRPATRTARPSGRPRHQPAPGARHARHGDRRRTAHHPGNQGRSLRRALPRGDTRTPRPGGEDRPRTALGMRRSGRQEAGHERGEDVAHLARPSSPGASACCSRRGRSRLRRAAARRRPSRRDRWPVRRGDPWHPPP